MKDEPAVPSISPGGPVLTGTDFVLAKPASNYAKFCPVGILPDAAPLQRLNAVRYLLALIAQY